jgi:hypothetical protein
VALIVEIASSDALSTAVLTAVSAALVSAIAALWLHRRLSRRR